MHTRTGRPPLSDVAATQRITVRVTPAQRLELRRVASDNRTGMAGIIREAVNEYVADYGDHHPFRMPKRESRAHPVTREPVSRVRRPPHQGARRRDAHDQGDRLDP